MSRDGDDVVGQRSPTEPRDERDPQAGAHQREV
jgi:hypothetical protein